MTQKKKKRLLKEGRRAFGALEFIQRQVYCDQILNQTGCIQIPGLLSCELGGFYSYLLQASVDSSVQREQQWNLACCSD